MSFQFLSVSGKELRLIDSITMYNNNKWRVQALVVQI